ncbi:MAG TPA: hypothetical protein GXZ36_06955 [Firmicutes bacterium]|nr:hypothetical protein [Bacillota bacterium]
MVKNQNLQRIYAIIVTCLLILISLSGRSYAAPTAEGELRTNFLITPDDSGFDFDGLTLDFSADFSAEDGVRGELNYDGRSVDTLAYYYIDHIFADDQINVGRFAIDWASKRSVTFNGSLAEQVQRMGGVAWPRDLGFEKGIGVKYKIDFPSFALVASVSNYEFGEGTDLVGRGVFKINPNLQIGAGLASINRDTDVNDFAVLIDAGFTSGPVNLLFEVVGVNSEHGTEEETNSGFYAEAAYEASQRFTVYGSFCGAEDLTEEMLAAGVLTRITPYATIRGELQNTKDDWNFLLGLKVNF